MQNHFDLFHLPARFEMDGAALDKAYHEVQSQVHPDKFAHAGDAEKRVAMQWATRANEAYRTLKSPLKRARYMCELHGIDLQTETNTAMAPGFLMQQMEWREELDDVKHSRDSSALDGLDAALRSALKAQIASIANLLDKDDYAAAATQVRQLMFLEKFAEEIGDAFALLEQ
ncbi:Fe-S protein assembly co-chaperone HscB [Herbaspirillum sp. RTI4]|uniref:Fe-S protein assembly co-chaperone HscB n=1 Tax=Herbaspirillum sp. RTI4 TaxID=3048640 RepID=UPI002AB406CF|nr:Fe-S protein assembly co-chaperone HscB [Herbaspirillum sp. RTI4]MDY7579669.1 Fe-S protein assembly co-chaperone HscB [Herbaspirillum sp. RTI4]MEA9981884.1 Fe-S protein assembly co-chaperone HscB [Herbaspirillum sp. RTI4]